MDSGLTTGAVVIALFWAAWEVDGKKESEKREVLLSGLFVSILSIFVARFLALSFPFRIRPINVPDLHARTVYGVSSEHLINWSSFPSDHATLFACLAAVLWMVSRRLGAVAFLHALLVIDIPRIYAGVHYATDILVGTLIGIAMALLVQLPKFRSFFATPVMHWKESYPTLFQIGLFLCTFEIAEMFDTMRSIGTYAIHFAHARHLASWFTH
jgi:undecaprenyl-diphosphatase